MITAAGFENVQEDILKMPIRAWSKDPHLKQVGMWQQLFAETGIEGHGLAILTRVLGVCLSPTPGNLFENKFSLNANWNSGHMLKQSYLSWRLEML